MWKGQREWKRDAGMAEVMALYEQVTKTTAQLHAIPWKKRVSLR